MYAMSVAQRVRGTLEARDELLLVVGTVGHVVGIPPLEVTLAHHSLCTVHCDLMHACKRPDVSVGVHPDGAHQLNPVKLPHTQSIHVEYFACNARGCRALPMS